MDYDLRCPCEQARRERPDHHSLPRKTVGARGRGSYSIAVDPAGPLHQDKPEPEPRARCSALESKSGFEYPCQPMLAFMAGGETLRGYWPDLTWSAKVFLNVSDVACAERAKREIERHPVSCDLICEVLAVARGRRAVMNPPVVPESTILDYDRGISLSERALWRACEQ